MNILLTGPCATPYAREYISNAAATLRQRGYRVFVPHEGGWHAPNHPAVKDRFDFEATLNALQECDILVAVLDGYTVDDGVAAQIGSFHTLSTPTKQKRQIIGVLHDTRVAGWDWTGKDNALHPQIRESIRALGKVVPNFNQVFTWIEEQA